MDMIPGYTLMKTMCFSAAVLLLFYDKGMRYYLNLRGKIKIRALKNAIADIGLRASNTVYTNKAVIGSGPDEIPGSQKTELKLQLFLFPGSKNLQGSRKNLFQTEQRMRKTTCLFGQGVFRSPFLTLF